MQTKSAYKVPGGKLIRATVETEGDSISAVSLTGDFFMYPEEGIDTINSSLRGEKVDEARIASKISGTIQENQIKVIGATPEDFAKAIVMAKEAPASE